MRARRCVVTIGDDVDADKPMGAGLTSILALCRTAAQEDVRSVALRPNGSVPSLDPLVGDREQ
jgi:hypothetical protein